jgi:hypothetical protein
MMFVELSTNNTQPFFHINTPSLAVVIYLIKRTIRDPYVNFKIIKMINNKYHTVGTFPKSIDESYKEANSIPLIHNIYISAHFK